MAALDLTKYGITGTTEIVHNPSYETLFEEETKASLEGYEKGQVTELGAVNVKTGIYTGRSPKDKFIVVDENSKDTVWWTTEGYKNDNHPMSESTWAVVKDRSCQEGTLEQASLRCRCFLRRQQRHASRCSLHRGSCLAGSLRDQHVHQAHG